MDKILELAAIAIAGLIVEVIRRLRKENTEQHEANQAAIIELRTDHADTKAEVRDIKADVREVKSDVREIRDVIREQHA